MPEIWTFNHSSPANCLFCNLLIWSRRKHSSQFPSLKNTYRAIYFFFWTSYHCLWVLRVLENNAAASYKGETFSFKSLVGKNLLWCRAQADSHSLNKTDHTSTAQLACTGAVGLPACSFLHSFPWGAYGERREIRQMASVIGARSQKPFSGRATQLLLVTPAVGRESGMLQGKKTAGNSLQPWG